MTLHELLAKVESAAVGGDELSAHIVARLLIGEHATVKQSPINGAWCIYDGVDRRGQPRLAEFTSSRGLYRPEGWPVSTSLDAAVALVDRVLPGRAMLILVDGTDNKAGIAKGAGDSVWMRGDSESSTPALAICRAILRAKIAEASVG